MWLQTEFMVDMSCEGCVKAVENKLHTVDGECYWFSRKKTFCKYIWLTKMALFCNVALGIKSIDVDLANQVVRIFGSSPVKTMAEALEQTGRKARLIGQGLPGGSFLFSFIVYIFIFFFCVVFKYSSFTKFTCLVMWNLVFCMLT